MGAEGVAGRRRPAHTPRPDPTTTKSSLGNPKFPFGVGKEGFILGGGAPIRARFKLSVTLFSFVQISMEQYILL